jgi:hypothetical protein
MSTDKVYTYFRLDFKGCSFDYNSTIVESLSDIAGYLQAVEMDLEDLQSNAKVTITGVGMTRKEYENWFKENVKP